MPSFFYMNQEFFPFESNVSKDSYDDFVNQCVEIIQKWQSKQNIFKLHTSGSTGIAKEIEFTREQIQTSAELTLKSFNLKKGGNFLVCLSPLHVAGFMMIVRAMVNQSNIIFVEPSKNPLQNLAFEDKINFAAFIPYQLQAILDNKKLDKIEKMIIGGGQISKKLLQSIQQVEPEIYHTYGMTETLTHVAIKRLNGQNPDDYFKALNGIDFKVDESGCLMVNSPICPENYLKTNDIVELIDSKSFKWIGRKDNVINSAGIKINLDQLENKIRSSIQNEINFFLYGKSDGEYGQKLCMAIENPSNKSLEDVKTELKNKLFKYEIPKEIIIIDKFEMTSLGKIDKIKTLEKSKVK